MSFTVGASSACTAIKPSAMTVPSKSAIRGLSVKFGPLSLRTCCFQFTVPNLFSAPKISFGNGTTTSSTVVVSCLILMCCGAWAAFAHSANPQSTPRLDFKCLINGIIGSFDCCFRVRIQDLMERTLTGTGAVHNTAAQKQFDSP